MPEYSYKASALMGKGIADHLKGTRLAAHLLEIGNRFGHGDKYIKALANMALKGKTKFEDKDIFTQIRDRLAARHTQPQTAALDPKENPEDYKKRAGDLAKGINWHRVGDAVQLDQFVGDYIKKLAKNPEKGTHFRDAHRLFGEGKAKPESSDKFWSGLHAHAKTWTGPNSALGAKANQITPDKLKASVERLSNLEGYRAGLHERASRKLIETRPTQGFKGTGPVSEVDTLNWLPGSGPAYTGEGDKVKVKSNLHPEQYQKLSEPEKYALGLNSIGKALSGLGKIGTKLKPAQAVGPDGIAFSGEPGSQFDPTHSANLERQAVAHHLHGLGLIDLHDYAGRGNAHSKVDQYTDWARNHVRSNPKDILSQHYLKHLETLAGKQHTPSILHEGMYPLLNYAASSYGIGDRPELFHPDNKLPLAEEIKGNEDGTERVGEGLLKDSSTPTPEKLPFNLPSDPLTWAAENKRPLDDTPLPLSPSMGKLGKKSKGKVEGPVEGELPIESKGKKAPVQKEKGRERLKGRNSNAFDLLSLLESKGVPQEQWIRHLTDGGIPKRSAESLLKKWGAMKPEAKINRGPLLFSKAYQQAMKKKD